MTSYTFRSRALVTALYASSKYQWLNGTHTPSWAMEVRWSAFSFFLSPPPDSSVSGCRDLERKRSRGLREGRPDCKCRKTNAGLRNKVESDIIYPRLGCLIFTYFRVLVRDVEGGDWCCLKAKKSAFIIWCHVCWKVFSCVGWHLKNFGLYASIAAVFFSCFLHKCRHI